MPVARSLALPPSTCDQANVPLLLKGLARAGQEGTYIDVYVCDLDFGLWRGLLNWFRRFVVAATPGNGNETWHTAVCR